GDFRLHGISPGQYAAFAQPTGESDRYSDLAPFTVTDADVTGLIVKIHAGSRITGKVIIDGAADRQALPRLSDIQLSYSSGSLNVAHRSGMVRIAPDGSFSIIGLPAGITTFYIQFYLSPKGLTLTRIERDGIEQKEGIEVGADEDITGVKLIFTYGTGAIRGQVSVEGGESTSSTMMFLNLRRAGSKENVNNTNSVVDARGRFVVSGLSPGDYELNLYYQSRAPSPDNHAQGAITKQVKQTVSVTNGAETQVSLVVDLTREK